MSGKQKNDQDQALERFTEPSYVVFHHYVQFLTQALEQLSGHYIFS